MLIAGYIGKGIGGEGIAEITGPVIVLNGKSMLRREVPYLSVSHVQPVVVSNNREIFGRDNETRADKK